MPRNRTLGELAQLFLSLEALWDAATEKSQQRLRDLLDLLSGDLGDVWIPVFIPPKGRARIGTMGEEPKHILHLQLRLQTGGRLYPSPAGRRWVEGFFELREFDSRIVLARFNPSDRRLRENVGAIEALLSAYNAADWEEKWKTIVEESSTADMKHLAMEVWADVGRMQSFRRRSRVIATAISRIVTSNLTFPNCPEDEVFEVETLMQDGSKRTWFFRVEPRLESVYSAQVIKLDPALTTRDLDQGKGHEGQDAEEAITAI